MGLLSYLYGPGERGDHVNPRLIAGEGHGAPLELLAEPESLPYLAHALDVPVERLGTRASVQPTWFCSVRSDTRQPDPTDPQWAAIARRLVNATGIAPEGDPDACRWIAVRNRPRQVHVVATIAREDGSLHNAYRDAFRLQSECHLLAAELGHLPIAPQPTPRTQKTHMPSPSITITAEPSGSVSAKGASDDLSATLLKHAGFQQIDDWYGRRHRLPTTTPAADRAAIANHAAEMLRAARYGVDLDPTLDTTKAFTSANPLGPYTAGAELLRLTEQIRSAETGADLKQVLDHLLDPEHGALERIREALEAAGEQITDLDDEAFQLADRFGFAEDFVHSAMSELVHSEDELLSVGRAKQAADQTRTRSRWLPDVQGAALAASPAAAKAQVSSSPDSQSAQPSAAGHPPRAPGPRL
ncbi:hypothetical protein [Streptomyces anulatus]|uniref:hypothetical protein n=1 Tax=Streptomyces anulatus TaxID=1892 RepID=UPI00343502D8